MKLFVILLDIALVAFGIIYLCLLLPSAAAPFEGNYLEFSSRELLDVQSRTWFWIAVGGAAGLAALWLLTGKRFAYLGRQGAGLRAALAISVVVGSNAAYLAIPWWLAADALENHRLPVGPSAFLGVIYLGGGVLLLATCLVVGLRKATYDDRA